MFQSVVRASEVALPGALFVAVVDEWGRSGLLHIAKRSTTVPSTTRPQRQNTILGAHVRVAKAVVSCYHRLYGVGRVKYG